ncbi:MAG TPA: hypothetical protein VHW44_20885 [Pseudonocardiaceae bacterium]|jgi:hypothetical protein|nr:hypothetical protein [Pseudonocardiaceae bacterium]
MLSIWAPRTGAGDAAELNEGKLQRMGKFERQQKKLDKLEKEETKGKIAYEKLVEKGNKVVDKMVKVCPHKNTETETVDGQTIVWCNDCTGQVS